MRIWLSSRDACRAFRCKGGRAGPASSWPSSRAATPPGSATKLHLAETLERKQQNMFEGVSSGVIFGDFFQRSIWNICLVCFAGCLLEVLDEKELGPYRMSACTCKKSTLSVPTMSKVVNPPFK